MTPADFAAARQQLGVSQLELALRLGIEQASVNRYEHGAVAVPREVAYSLLRLTRRVGGPCVQCGRPTVVEFWDHCCGRCTKPLSEDAP